MSDFSDTLHVAQKPLQCPGCGVFVAPEAGRCPHCGSPITPSTLEDNFTRPLPRRPSALQTSGTRHDTLLPDALVVLQLLPSGAVIPLKLMEPVTLGRFSIPLPSASAWRISRRTSTASHASTAAWPVKMST